MQYGLPHACSKDFRTDVDFPTEVCAVRIPSHMDFRSYGSPCLTDFRREVRTVRTSAQKSVQYRLPYGSPYSTDFRTEVRTVRTSVRKSVPSGLPYGVRTVRTSVRKSVAYGLLYRSTQLRRAPRLCANHVPTHVWHMI